MGPTTTDRLDEYRRKRDAGRTPEPFAAGDAGAGGIFVVQKHAASRLHYDLRLEHDGVLLSWAVPAGPSRDPAVKRFAAHTEDHPLEYADFEGVIPAGEYGGGAMIVWDRGSLTFDEDPDEGIAKGKLLFSLAGYKLSGQWTLVRMKDPAEWLLMKKPDAWASDHEVEFDERSILSGMTVDEIAHPREWSDALTGTAVGAGAIVGTVDAMTMGLMLASTADAPFSNPDWVFEIKYDGYRMVLDKRDRRIRLRYRSGLDASAVFPEIVSAARRLPVDTVTLDGEIVVLDELGKPSFTALQRRGALTNRFEVASAAARSPATFFAFDIVAVGDLDTRPAALVDRKEMVRSVTPSLGPIRYSDHVAGMGEAMYAEVTRMGLEGIIAKRASSAYSAGRSDAWRKIRVEQSGRFAIVGYTVPRGTRSGLGALHLAVRNGAKLGYAGRVGTGFGDATLSELRSLLQPDEAADPGVDGAPSTAKEDRWVTPRWMATVRYKEFTEAGSLRHPVFEGFEPLAHDSLADAPAADHEPPRPAIADARTTEPTNTDKVFWPGDGFTKGDLIEYYTAVAEHLLPYLRDRPLVLDRFPDGIEGKSFFQKNAPDYAPDWIRTEWIEGTDETGNNYFVVEDVEALRYVANMGSIPLHIWASRIRTLETPDWCILDLDPKTAAFTSVVTVARAIHELCDDIGLPHVVKTSGKTGLHILIPMRPPLTYDHQRMLGSLIAGVVEGMLPEIATTIRSPSDRGDKVYIDHLQNGRGKLLVAPFSVRPVPGATVSTPLRWSEVTPSLDVSRFTMTSVRRRLAAMRTDPFDDLLTAVPDIPSALSRLDDILRA